MAKTIFPMNDFVHVLKGSGQFSSNRNHVLTLHAKFPVVALLDAGGTEPDSENDPQEKARFLYVGATRATQKLVLSRSC